MSILKLVTAPAFEPLSLDEAKLHLRVDSTDEDTLISRLIWTAREYLEAQQGSQLITATYDLSFYCWPSTLTLPKPPCQSITSVKYYDEDGVERTLSTSAYRLHKPYRSRAILVFKSDYDLPTVDAREDAITVRFIAGYGNREDVPELTKTAMLLLVAEQYKNREATISGTIIAELPIGLDRLIQINNSSMEFN